MKTIEQVKNEARDYADSILNMAHGVENFESLALANLRVASSILFAAGMRREATTIQSMHELIVSKIEGELSQ